MVVIGIDLGTSNSVVAVSCKGRVSVLENEYGKRTTPSCVAFTKLERLIGESAMHQLIRNPENTILDAKTLLGRSFESAKELVEQKAWPYRLEENDRRPIIKVEYQEKEKFLYPEEIIAMILCRLKKIAEDNLGELVTGAVITVPTSFDAAQRRAIVDSANIAGLPPLGLINETVAAAVAFGHKQQPASISNLLVLHVGAGTFDATVLTVEDKTYRVKGTYGNSCIGGDKYHETIFNEILSPEKRDSIGRSKNRALCKLRLACRKAKEELTLSKYSNIRVDRFSNGEDIQRGISEEKFLTLNKQCSLLFERGIKKALERANIDARKIDHVILVGAATRMHIIPWIITERCGIPRGKIRKTINVEEAPAEGAAIQAELLSSRGKEVDDIVIQDVAGYSIQCDGDVDDTICIKHCPLPVRRFLEISGFLHGRLTFELFVKGYKDKKLGEFIISSRTNQCPKPLNVKIEITIDGLLEVRAFSFDGEIEFTEKTGLDKNTIACLIAEAERYLQEEEEKKAVSTALHDLEKKLLKVKSMADEMSYHLPQQIFLEFQEMAEWIDRSLVLNVKMDEIQYVQDRLRNIQHQLEIAKCTEARESRSYANTTLGPSQGSRVDHLTNDLHVAAYDSSTRYSSSLTIGTTDLSKTYKVTSPISPRHEYSPATSHHAGQYLTKEGNTGLTSSHRDRRVDDLPNSGSHRNTTVNGTHEVNSYNSRMVNTQRSRGHSDQRGLSSADYISPTKAEMSPNYADPRAELFELSVQRNTKQRIGHARNVHTPKDGQNKEGGHVTNPKKKAEIEGACQSLETPHSRIRDNSPDVRTTSDYLATSKKTEEVDTHKGCEINEKPEAIYAVCSSSESVHMRNRKEATDYNLATSMNTEKEDKKKANEEKETNLTEVNDHKNTMENVRPNLTSVRDGAKKKKQNLQSGTKQSQLRPQKINVPPNAAQTPVKSPSKTKKVAKNDEAAAKRYKSKGPQAANASSKSGGSKQSLKIQSVPPQPVEDRCQEASDEVNQTPRKAEMRNKTKSPHPPHQTATQPSKNQNRAPSRNASGDKPKKTVKEQERLQAKEKGRETRKGMGK